jgi:hypothetical protein
LLFRSVQIPVLSKANGGWGIFSSIPDWLIWLEPVFSKDLTNSDLSHFLNTCWKS